MNPNRTTDPHRKSWAWVFDYFARTYAYSEPKMVMAILADLILKGELVYRDYGYTKGRLLDGRTLPKKRLKEFYRYTILRTVYFARLYNTSGSHLLAWEIELSKLGKL